MDQNQGAIIKTTDILKVLGKLTASMTIIGGLVLALLRPSCMPDD
jgi:hypothetical protein